MGKVDTVTKAYMRKNNIFADAFNYLIYEGKPVVDPEQLRELDTTEIALPFGSQEKENGQSDDLVQKYRDILKSAVVMQEDEVAYILLGIENQTDIHYAMPVRNMIYDALQYGKQVADTAANHRKSDKSFRKRTSGEYLSGFYKAIDDMLSEREARGEIRGIEIGELRMLVKQVKRGRLTIEEAAEDVAMSVEKFRNVTDDMLKEG